MSVLDAHVPDLSADGIGRRWLLGKQNATASDQGQAAEDQ